LNLLRGKLITPYGDLNPLMNIKKPLEWGVSPVPRKYRLLRIFDYFVLWSSLGVGLLVFQAGSLLTPSLSLLDAFLISLVGSVIGSLLLAAAGIYGSRFGVPTMVSLRPVMGSYGSYLATALNVIQLVGWTAFEILIMGEAAAQLSGDIFGEYTTLFWISVVTLWCWLLAIGGPLTVVREWLEKFAIWLVYFSTIWITYSVVSHPQFQYVLTAKGSGGLPPSVALDLVIAMPISWMPLISDYSRFAKDDKSSFLGTFLGYTLANTWFYALGASFPYVLREDVVPAIASLTFGNLALIFILLDETDNGFADIYSTAVSIQNIFPKIRQWKLITLTSLLGGLLALTIPLKQYEYFLLMIGALFIPLFGVTLSDFYILRKRYREEDFYKNVKKIKVSSIIAWVVGVVTYFLIYQYYPDIGASLPAFSASFLLKALLEKFSTQ